MTDHRPDINDLSASRSRLGTEWPKQDHPSLYEPKDDASKTHNDKVDVSQDLGCLADLGGCFTIIAVMVIASVASTMIIL